MTAEDHEKRLLRLGEFFVISMIEDALRTGEIDDTISDVKVLQSFIGRKLRPGVQFHGVIDHRGTLLKEARKLLDRNEQELGLLVFATWLEHYVNSIIEGQARKAKLPHDEISQILRETSMAKGKLTWLLQLLELPRLTPKKLNLINRIMDLRNGFVHYKWKLQNLDEYRVDKEIVSVMKQADGLVKYLQQYEQRNIVKFSKTNIKQLLKKIEVKNRG